MNGNIVYFLSLDFIFKNKNQVVEKTILSNRK
jgi:hypothetical protein